MVGQLVSQWWGFVVLGLCAGILSGMLGLGSGVIVVPALVFLCGFGQKTAQGTALAVMVPMALVGAFRYWRNPEIDLRGVVIAMIALGAVVGTLFGTELVGRLPAATLRRLFAVFLIVVAVRMLITSPRSETAPGRSPSVDRMDGGATEPGGATDDTTTER